jgi:hypothetical protein
MASIASLDGAIRLNKPSVAIGEYASMTTIQFVHLSTSQAEEVIAKVWVLLEKHDIPSPKLTITSMLGDWQIEFHFQAKVDAAMISLAAGIERPVLSHVSARGHAQFA